VGEQLAPAPVVLRVFLALDADGSWHAMPGGLAHVLGETAEQGIATPPTRRGAAKDRGTCSSTLRIDRRAVEGALLVRRGRKVGSGPAVRRIRIAGTDPEERLEVAREVLPVLVDLSLRIRSAPVPLFSRASWTLAEGGNATAFKKDLARDTEHAAVRLVMGRPDPTDLDRQLPGRTEAGLPDGSSPTARWASALADLRDRSLVMECVA
jgi:hypothetical protein